jgi:hypothetical protein
MLTSITALAASRQQINGLFDEFIDEATDLTNMDKLYEVEAQIETATFETDAEKLAGYRILFELNDAPDFADQFKARLFMRMQQFA